jgi:hypothetical protein
MLFGEIDCREGLLMAVQKCKVRKGRVAGLQTPAVIMLTEMRKTWLGFS